MAKFDYAALRNRIFIAAIAFIFIAAIAQNYGSSGTSIQGYSIFGVKKCYKDTDNDGYGNILQSRFAVSKCMKGYVPKSLDCNNGDPAINPGAYEVCDSIDNNCNGNIDEGDVCEANYTSPYCSSDWICADWSNCASGVQTRICSDANNCGTSGGKPSETQACGTAPGNNQTTCSPSWACTQWSACTSGVQTRICNQVVICSANDVKPAERQNCLSQGCFDSDTVLIGPPVFLTKGTCTDSTGTYTDYCSGTSPSSVIEYRCNDVYNNGVFVAYGQCVTSSYSFLDGTCIDGIWDRNPMCVSNWVCTPWSACSSGTQTRICTDAEPCATNFGKPAETQSCSAPGNQTCTPYWSCSGWSACASGTQTRTCVDTNCGTNANKPATSQSCSVNDVTYCVDSDGNGAYYSKGTCIDSRGILYTDYCRTEHEARDYYCQGTYGAQGMISNYCADGGISFLTGHCVDGAWVY